MLMNRETSSLLVVDVQERLLPSIADGEAVLSNCNWLVGVARRMGVPVVVSEQYPEGLGPTAASLRWRMRCWRRTCPMPPSRRINWPRARLLQQNWRLVL